MEQTSPAFSQASDVLARQHRLIEQLFLAATVDLNAIDSAAYDQFRAAILRHAAIEEQVVLPLLRKHLPGGFPMELQLRMEHDAIAALCVIPPNPDVLLALLGLMIRHNRLEEAHGTLYELFNDCVRRETEDVRVRMNDFRHSDPPRFISNPLAFEYARRAIKRAGYEQDVLAAEGKNALDDYRAGSARSGSRE